MRTMDGPQTEYADRYRARTSSIEMVSGGQDLVGKAIFSERGSKFSDKDPRMTPLLGISSFT